MSQQEDAELAYLQSLLDEIVAWYTKWKLQLNVSKTEAKTVEQNDWIQLH